MENRESWLCCSWNYRNQVTDGTFSFTSCYSQMLLPGIRKTTKKTPNKNKHKTPPNKQKTKQTKPILKKQKEITQKKSNKNNQKKHYSYSPNLNSKATSPFWELPAAMIEQFLPHVVYCKLTFSFYLDSTNQLCFAVFSSSQCDSFLLLFFSCLVASPK